MSEPENSREELIDFIGTLRRSGYNISTEQYVSAHRLLCVLAARGDWPGDPRRFGRMLSPLLCSTREEQDSFPRHYDQWLRTRPVLFRRATGREKIPTPAPKPIAVPKPKRDPLQLRLKWWGWVASLGFAALLIFILYKLPDSFSKQAVTTAPTATPGNKVAVGSQGWAPLIAIVGWVVLGVGGAVIFIFVLVRLLRYTRQLGLKKWRARESQRVDNLRVKGASEQLTRSLPLRRIAQEMRRYRAFEETDLNVPKTVEETIRTGVFTPAFTSRKALPEYLVLIDRATFADQQARLVDDIVNLLARNDVLIERYFFQEDPRICHKDGLKAQFHTLQDLAVQHPRHYLLIFSDGVGFFNPLTGRPHRWLESFASWPTRLLLTSEVQAGDYRDWVLNELGFSVLPAGRAGLAGISESLDGGALRRSSGPQRGAPLPPLLRGRPGQWLKSHPPRAELLDELCTQLKAFLGDGGYYWLSACAVYPLLYLDLTFYLGERLGAREDLFDTYSKLVRLPWFRGGSMPDWMRARLIIDLDETKEQAIRTALEDLLIGSLKQPEGFILPVVTGPKPDARDESGFLRKRWAKLKGEVDALRRRYLAEDIMRSQPDDSRLHDYVAVTFMSGRKPNKLAVKVPREVYPVLYPAGQPVLDTTLGVTVFVIALLASLVMLTPMLEGSLPVIVGSLAVWGFYVGLNVWAVRELTRGSRVTAEPDADVEVAEPPAVGGMTVKKEENRDELNSAAGTARENAARGGSSATDTSVGQTPARSGSPPLNFIPIFVSSTWIDLTPERASVRLVIQRLRETKFAGIEYFSNGDETTRRDALDGVEQSAAYIGIFGARYSSGLTEVEYVRARNNELPCFIYFKDEAAILDDQRETDPERAASLAALKNELRRNHIVTTFKTPEELGDQVAADLLRWLFDSYLTSHLEKALRGEAPLDRARTLLDAVKDLSELSPDLLARLRSAGFNIARGSRDPSVGSGVVSDYDSLNEVFRPVRPTLHQLRAPVGDFVGREKEIDELLAALRGGSSAAITGMGGIGKTELAFYVAEHLRDTYPDAQLVVDMRGDDDNPRAPADALAACIRAFIGFEQRLSDEPQELARLYRGVLEGKRVLILLDNARDGAQVRPLLPPAGSALLITSRETLTLPGLRRVGLEQLEPGQARELLIGIAPRVPPDVADEICLLCGYLPLAIRAAGSLLAVTVDLDPADYALQLRDERTRRELLGDVGATMSVEASFNLSYSRLSANAALVFRQLSVFPDSFDARAEEAVCDDRKHRHLSELLRRNLVSYNLETQRYRLHNLTRLFAESRLSDDERRATWMRHAEHYVTVLRECDEFYLKGGAAIISGLALFDVERRNIEAGQEWASRQASGDAKVSRLCTAYPDAGAYVLTLRLHPRELISWLEAALAAARRLNDRASEGRHLGNLGIIYANLGETPRAIEFLEQHLVIAREMGDLNSEGKALGNLGYAYAELGEVRRAIEFHEQSLAIGRRVGDRRGEALALGNLGSNYKALGEFRRAIEYNEQSLVIAREIGDRLREGWTLGNLGSAYTSLGETPRAVEFYEQSLLIAREIGDRRGEGDALFNLGTALNELGDRAKAIAYAEAALEILEQIESSQAERVRDKLSEWRD